MKTDDHPTMQTARMPGSNCPDGLPALRAHLNDQLLKKYGPMLGKHQLVEALGFASMDALERALQRELLTDLRIFTMRNRRGRFALALDVATYLANAALQPAEQHPEDNMPEK